MRFAALRSESFRSHCSSLQLIDNARWILALHILFLEEGVDGCVSA